MTVGQLRERLAEFPDFYRISVTDPEIVKRDDDDDFPPDLEIEDVKAAAGAEVEVQVDLFSFLDPYTKRRMRKRGRTWAR